jgi:predicted NAD-dependent protein-ADP-ribosyltransferase YbiA (DUF1768 family)
MFRYLFVLLFLGCSLQNKHKHQYPEHWWKALAKEKTQWWEVPPQAANAGEVILSKRNELGILSNFAATSFIFRGKKYASVEGFWQAMKYPEEKLDNSIDPRHDWKLLHTRDQVSMMVGLEAKAAGDEAEKIMQEKKVDWVSFEGKKITYCSTTPAEHYQLIREAMLAKLEQNPDVKQILLATGNLKLRPDHIEEDCRAPEWKYYQLWMEIRDTYLR